MNQPRAFRGASSILIIFTLLCGLLGSSTQPVRGEPFDHSFIVNTADPMTPDILPGDKVCQTANGDCSLFAAIQEANAVNGADVITFIPTITLIEFDEDDCCLPPLSDMSDGTTIRGEGLVTLKHSGPVTTDQNDVGITILSDDNRIQGLTIQYFDYAIALNGYRNTIGQDGDTIGDPTEGVTLTNNAAGIQLFGDNNLIANTTISDNEVYGILAGEYAINNVIGISGGVLQPAGNQISNTKNGIIVKGDNNTIAGNVVLNCTEAGITLSALANNNTIGTNGDNLYDAMESNTIGYINAAGIVIEGSSNIIAGNYSGTNAASQVTPNVVGLRVDGANNLIGSNGDGISDTLERNHFAGNQNANVQLRGDDNDLLGNWIGVLPNGSGTEDEVDGIEMCSAYDNLIGNVTPGLGNLIAYNQIGIDIHDDCGRSLGNTLRGNSIHDNRVMGINLAFQGVEPNEPRDPDMGTNNLQNYPELSAALSGELTTVIGTYNSVPNDPYNLDFYASTDCSGTNRSGEDYLGTLLVQTDAQGNASFIVELPQVDAGRFITALATNDTRSTSEFSACVPVVQAPDNGIMQVNSVSDGIDQDSDDGVCDTGGLVGDQPECTLRAAIQQANASSGSDILLLMGGNYVLTIDGTGEENAASGDLDINDDLSIIGVSPAATVIDANGLDRVFDLSPLLTATLTMTHLTIQGGSVMTTGSAIEISGTLSLLNSVVRYNTSGADGTLHVQPTGSLYLAGSTVYSNTVSGDGGGIFAMGSVEVVNSTISSNQANGNGGGIYFSENTHRLANVTITENTADADADQPGDGDGGGVYNNIGEVSVQNSILAQNRDLSDSGQQDGTNPWDCAGVFISNGYNLVSDIQGCTGFSDTSGDLVGGFWQDEVYVVYPANLGALADNGGATPTYMPKISAGNMVIDQGNPADPGSEPAACSPLDQRGIPRPKDGDGDDVAQCDRGAVEFALPAISVQTPVVVEGEEAFFIIRLAPASPMTVTLEYTATANTAEPGPDFVPITGTLVFPPGVFYTNVAVVTMKDTLNEGEETFWLELKEIQNARLLTTHSQGVILDNNPLPTISVHDLSVDEGTGGKSEAEFVVTVSYSSTADIRVWFSTATGTAKTEDFDPLAGWLTVPALQLEQTIRIAVVGDDLPEVSEVFSMLLSEPQGARPGDDRALCTIQDDDNYFAGFLYLPTVVK